MTTPEMNQQDREQIVQAIQNGQKIQAIKIYRDCTGQSLLEAKNFIEGLTEELEIQVPESSSQAAMVFITFSISILIAIAVAIFVWVA